MSNEFKLEIFVNEVTEKLEKCAERILEETASIIESQAKRNSAVDTGQLKNSWTHHVDNSEKKVTIGSPLENAVWEEFGTGEYALNGNGRKGGWVYADKDEKWHFTKGKKPRRALHKSYTSKKNSVIRKAQDIMKEGMK